MPYKLAAVDIGTNSILLTIVQVDGEQIHTLCERSWITRLGEGLNATGRLAAEPIQRSLQAIHALREEIHHYGAETVLAVGTEVLRKAENASDFLNACEQAGLRVEVISGEREAQLSFLSVAKDPLFSQRVGRTVMMDVGGGSTEISRGIGETLQRSQSYPIGAVRLTEAYLRSDPPTPAEVDMLREAVKNALRNEPPLEGQDRLVGVGGTFVNLASLHAGCSQYDPLKVHGTTLALQQVEQLASRLCALPLSQRRQLPGIEPERAPVLHAGALIVHAAMQHLQAENITVSMRGLRWGLIYEFVDANRH